MTIRELYRVSDILTWFCGDTKIREVTYQINLDMSFSC